MTRNLERRIAALETKVQGLTDGQRAEALLALLEQGRLTYENGVWGSGEAGRLERLARLLSRLELRRQEVVSEAAGKTA